MDSMKKETMTFNFDELLPKTGLTQIKENSRDVYLLHIPILVDQTQNFLQLYHGKKITSGYISYRAQSTDIRYRINEDPFYSKLYCRQPHEAPLYLEENFPQTFFKSVDDNNIGYIIINKYLINLTGCGPLTEFIESDFSQHTQYKLIDENRLYQIYEVNSKKS